MMGYQTFDCMTILFFPTLILLVLLYFTVLEVYTYRNKICYWAALVDYSTFGLSMLAQLNIRAMKRCGRFSRNFSNANPPTVVDNQAHPANKYNSEAQENALVATKVGFLTNIFLAVSKGATGVAVGSAGLIADSANSFGDLLCDWVVYFSINEARKEATPERPWGSGKFEHLGALTVGGLLLCTGGGVAYGSLQSAIEIATAADGGALVSEVLNSLPSSNGPATVDTVEVITEASRISFNALTFGAMGISLVSIISKELLFQYTLKAGIAATSSVVIANAWQHRADVCVSAAVLAGLVGAAYGYPLLDPLAGLVVSGVIVKQGLESVIEAVRDLNDAPATTEETNALKQTCLSIGGVKTITELIARKSGPYLFVECTVGVAGVMTASSAHRMSVLIRQSLLTVHAGRVAQALVHVLPLGANGMGEKVERSKREFDAIMSIILKTLQPSAGSVKPDDLVTQVTGINEVQLYYLDNGHIGIKADVYMNPLLTIKQAHEVAIYCRGLIQEAIPGVTEVDVDLELDAVCPLGNSFVLPSNPLYISNFLDVHRTGDECSSNFGQKLDKKLNGQLFALKKRWTPMVKNDLLG